MRIRATAASLTLVVGVVVLAGCGGDSDAFDTESSGPDPTTASPQPSEGASTSGARSGPPEVIGTVARDLEVPWGIGFLPDDSALVTERNSGRVLQITGDEV